MVRKNILAFLFYTGFLLVGVFLAKDGWSAEKKNFISLVSIDETKPVLTKIEAKDLADKTLIGIEATEEIQYIAFKVNNPLRLVVDIVKTSVGNFNKPIKVNLGVVEQIKPTYISDENLTRLEIELKETTSYEIFSPDPNKITISIKKALNSVGENANSAVLTKVADIAPSVLPAEKGSNSTLKKITDTPVKLVSSDKSSVMNSKFKQETEIGIVSKKNLFPLLNRPIPGLSDRIILAQLPEGVAPLDKFNPISIDQEKKYKGKLVSLDFQDADIKSILRLIAEVSELNILATEEVNGKLSMRLTNVPWDQALDVIMKSKELGMEKEDNILRIAPMTTLTRQSEEKIRAEQAKLEAVKAKERSEELITEIIPINYARAGDLKSNLDKLKSERGDISTNERTNTLILQDIKKNLAEMKFLIRELDRQTPQVLIEARIVEVTRTFTRQLGIQWGGGVQQATPLTFPSRVNLRGSTTPTGGLNVINSLPSGYNYVVNMPAPVGQGVGAGVGVTFGHVANSLLLDVQLTALENTGKGKILSNPKIATEDNREALIESGRSVPYATVSQAGTQVQFVDAVISLLVTPHITMDNFISMKISATKNDVDFGNVVQGTPTILKKKANTQVLVKDGDTTVIGGLYTSTQQESLTGVPWFSKIPYLGWFFKSSKEVDEGTELLIFITPKILKS